MESLYATSRSCPSNRDKTYTLHSRRTGEASWADYRSSRRLLSLRPPQPSKYVTMPIYSYLGGMVTCPAPFDLLYSIHLLQEKDYELGCIRGDC